MTKTEFLLKIPKQNQADLSDDNKIYVSTKGLLVDPKLKKLKHTCKLYAW